MTALKLIAAAAALAAVAGCAQLTEYRSSDLTSVQVIYYA